MDFLIAWRGELSGVVALVGTWVFFRCKLKQNFWILWVPGAMLGLANEFITESAWTYSLQLYVWRDVSPVVIAGWGVVFAWLVTLSDVLYRKLFGRDPGEPGARYLGLLLTDAVVGIPLLWGNEMIGLYFLQVWKYNSLLGWDSMLPFLNYPWEGLVCLILFVLAMPNTVRYWKRNRGL